MLTPSYFLPAAPCPQIAPLTAVRPGARGGGQSAAGDRMLAIVREMLPNATVNALQLNRNVVCGRPKDAKNSAAKSHILFFRHYSGGALVSETDERFREKNVWHGPMQSREYLH